MHLVLPSPEDPGEAHKAVLLWVRVQSSDGGWLSGPDRTFSKLDKKALLRLGAGDHVLVERPEGILPEKAEVLVWSVMLSSAAAFTDDHRAHPETVNLEECTLVGFTETPLEFKFVSWADIFRGIVEVRRRIQDLEADAGSSQEQLGSELALARKTVAELTRESAESKGLLVAATAQVEKLGHELDASKAEFSKLQGEAAVSDASHNAAIEELQARVRELTDVYSLEQGHRDALRKEMDSLTEALAEARGQLEEVKMASSGEVASLKDSLAEAQSQLEEAKKASSAEVLALQESLSEALSESRGHAAGLEAKHASRISELEAQLADIQAEMSRATAAADRLVEQLAAKDEEVSRLSEDLGEVNASLKVCQEENDRLSKLTEGMESLAHKEGTIIQLEEANEALRARLEEVEGVNMALYAQLDEHGIEPCTPSSAYRSSGEKPAEAKLTAAELDEVSRDLRFLSSTLGGPTPDDHATSVTSLRRLIWAVREQVKRNAGERAREAAQLAEANRQSSVMAKLMRTQKDTILALEDQLAEFQGRATAERDDVMSAKLAASLARDEA